MLFRTNEVTELFVKKKTDVNLLHMYRYTTNKALVQRSFQMKGYRLVRLKTTPAMKTISAIFGQTSLSDMDAQNI